MVEIEAITYISDFLGDDVVLVEAVILEIGKAPNDVRRHLEERCGTAEEMEQFLRTHSVHFIVENNRVGSYDTYLASGRAKAVDYFKNVLHFYNDPPDYMKFRGHVGQAEDDVIDFINSFYPGEEFRDFLLEHPEVFVMFEDGSVYLVENESVDYFEDCLEQFGDGQFYMNLRGRVAQAPRHVIQFVNNCYPGEKFLNFLEDNSDVFNVQNGYVNLIPDE